MSIDMINGLSAILGITGTWIIFKFGIPSRIDTGGKVAFNLMQKDEAEIKEISKYKILGNIGLFLVGVSFFLQLLLSIGLSWKILIS